MMRTIKISKVKSLTLGNKIYDKDKSLFKHPAIQRLTQKNWSSLKKLIIRKKKQLNN